MLKTIVILMLSTFALSTGASGCHAKQNAALPTQTPTTEKSTNAMKVLAEGFHSSINHPFIAVVRDAETYAALLKLDANLPKLDSDFFRSNVVVAAFLGERNTGGYSVEIWLEGAASLMGQVKGQAKGFIRIAEKAPGKGVMVPQMITSPFKVVSLEVNATDNIMLAPDYTWQQTMRRYRVTSGTFTMSGGLAGTTEQSGLAGDLRIMRERNLASFFFLVLVSDPKKQRGLYDFITVSVNPDGHLTINKMSAGSLVNSPNAGLKVTGTFTAGGSKISLNLNSLPTMIADGYSG